MTIPQRKNQMTTEWSVMKSILRHHCGADIYQIIDDLKSFCSEKERVFEGIASLMADGIITFSTEHFDFIFHPDTANSPLIKELKESRAPRITVDEYSSWGWRKLARLPF